MRSSRGMSIIIVIAMLATSIPMGLLFSTNASATSATFTSVYGNQGWVDNLGGHTHDDSYIGLESIEGTTYRTFLDFDTSAIPDDATIYSATLRVWYIWREYIDAPRQIYAYVYDTNYITFDGSLWNPTGSFQGSIFHSSATTTTWYSLDVSVGAISLTGNTNFLLKSSNEGIDNRVETHMSAYRPILDIVYVVTPGAVGVDIKLDGSGGWLNGSAYAEIQSYNNTMDMWKIELDTVPSTNWVNISMPSSASGCIFFSVIPYCVIDDSLPTNISLTGVYDSITYRVYILVPITISQTYSVFFALFNANTGLGIPWGTFRMMLSEGTTYNNTTGIPIFYQLQNLISGHNYTAQVLDYFDRAVTNYSFTVTIDNLLVDVQIETFNWKMTNQRDHFSLLTIYYGYYPSAFNYSIFIEPKGTESIDLQAGNYSFSAQIYYNNGTTGSTEWFNRTINSSGFIILEGTTWVKLHLYNGFTGLGISWDTFNVSYQISGESQTHATDSLISAKFDHDLTVIVRDFFNRELYNGTKMILDNTTSWNIPVYQYSTKFYNQRDNFTRVWIWYDYYAGGHIPYSEYLEPRGVANYPLLYGDYTFGITLYSNGGVPGMTYFWNRTVSSISFIMFNGTSIFEVWNVTNNLNLTGLGNLSGIALNISTILTFQAPRIHLSYFNNFTGIGLPPYAFNVSARVDNATLSRIDSELANGVLNHNMTIVVKDFFGRELYNQTKLINLADFYWDVGLPVFSTKFYNQKENFTKVWIWYDGILSGHPPYSEYLEPNGLANYYLLAGNYTFGITVFLNGITGPTYWWNRTVSDAGYVMLDGSTVYEVLTTAQGIQSMVQVITHLLEPSMIVIYSNVPSAPDAFGIARQMVVPARITTTVYQAYDVMTATRTQFVPRAGVNPANPQTSILYRPYENIIGTTTSIISDVLTILPTTTASGLYVNLTGGATLAYYATMPAQISMNGQNLTLYSDSCEFSVSRITTFKQTKTLLWYDYADTKHWSVTKTLYNNLSANLTSLYWSLYFQDPSKIDPDTIRVYDNDNGIYLVLGNHYDVTRSGVHFFWASFPALSSHTFTVDAYEPNDTIQGGAVAVATSYTDSVDTSFCGAGYEIADFTYTNAGSFTYIGTLVLKLDFKDADKIQTTSIKVYDVNKARLLNSDEFYYAGGTVTVLAGEVGTIQPGVSVHYLVSFVFDRAQTIGPISQPIISLFGFLITPLVILVIGLPVGSFIFIFTRKAPKKGPSGEVISYGSKHHGQYQWFWLCVCIAGIVFLLNSLGVLV